jgi:Tfp pilus assembly protein PilN
MGLHITLNLLPPEKKDELRAGFVYAYAQTMVFIIFLVAAFASGTLLAVRMMLSDVHDDLAARSTEATDESVAITEEIGRMNAYAESIKELQEKHVSWSHVLVELADLAPDEVQLHVIRVDREGRIFISGTAATRAGVLAMKDSLESSETFADVKAPLANILQQRNVKFDFEMRYGPRAAE